MYGNSDEPVSRTARIHVRQVIFDLTWLRQRQTAATASHSDVLRLMAQDAD